MKNAYRKTIELSEISDQVDSEYIEEADMFHPCDYDGDILIGKTGAILDGFHRTAGLIKYQASCAEQCSIKVIVVTHSKTIGIVADRNHRLHTKLVGLVANRV